MFILQLQATWCYLIIHAHKINVCIFQWVSCSFLRYSAPFISHSITLDSSVMQSSVHSEWDQTRPDQPCHVLQMQLEGRVGDQSCRHALLLAWLPSLPMKVRIELKKKCLGAPSYHSHINQMIKISPLFMSRYFIYVYIS